MFLLKSILGRRVIVCTLNFVLVSVIIFMLLELSFTFLLHNPSLLVGGLLTASREYYIKKDRKIIHFLPDCARYESSVTYTLKPGTCRFSAREFNVEYETNSAGTRDDEWSLNSPEIIVVGDSHAMGWGVNQQDTFSQIIEEQLGMKVLNAAVSSYGTVRELKLLERIDSEGLKYLVIQYWENDFNENKTYLTEGEKLRNLSEATYNSMVREHLEEVKYYFGKHSYNLIKKLVKPNERYSGFNASASGKTGGKIEEEEAAVFLNVLRKSSIDLRNVNAIVFEVNGYAKNDGAFVSSLDQLIAQTQTDDFVKSIKVLDASQVLKPEKYFILDDHIRNIGHQAIASALVEILQ